MTKVVRHTRSVVVRKTVTVSFTKRAAVRHRKRSVGIAKRDTASNTAQGTGFERAAGRNLCPVCPRGVAISSSSNAGLFNTNTQPLACCAPRKTVISTSTVTRTHTQTIKRPGNIEVKQTLSGRMFVDVNMNNVYDKSDTLLSNQEFTLSILTQTRKRIATLAIRTDASGRFSIVVALSPGYIIEIAPLGQLDSPWFIGIVGGDGELVSDWTLSYSYLIIINGMQVVCQVGETSSLGAWCA